MKLMARLAGDLRGEVPRPPSRGRPRQPTARRGRPASRSASGSSRTRVGSRPVAGLVGQRLGVRAEEPRDEPLAKQSRLRVATVGRVAEPRVRPAASIRCDADDASRSSSRSRSSRCASARRPRSPRPGRAVIVVASSIAHQTDDRHPGRARVRRAESAARRRVDPDRVDEREAAVARPPSRRSGDARRTSAQHRSRGCGSGRRSARPGSRTAARRTASCSDIPKSRWLTITWAIAVTIRVAPGAPMTSTGRAVAVDDRRRHPGDPALARRDGIRVARQRIEVDHRVVVHEPEARGDHARRPTQRMGQRDAGAVPIDDRDVRRAGRLHGRERDARSRPAGVDLSAPPRGALLRDQPVRPARPRTPDRRGTRLRSAKAAFIASATRRMYSGELWPSDRRSQPSRMLRISSERRAAVRRLAVDDRVAAVRARRRLDVADSGTPPDRRPSRTTPPRGEVGRDPSGQLARVEVVRARARRCAAASAA